MVTRDRVDRFSIDIPLTWQPPSVRDDILPVQTEGLSTVATSQGTNAVARALVDPSSENTAEDGIPRATAAAGPPFSRSSSTATGVSEVASEDGSTSARMANTPRRVVVGSPGMPPQSRPPPPSRTQSYYEEAVRSVLRPGQRALFFGKGTMGVVLKPTYLSW